MTFDLKFIGCFRTRSAGITALALSLSTGTISVFANDSSNGELHILKDCSGYNLMAGGHRQIRSSNLAEFPAGSLVYYTQAFGILTPAWLDSNVVVDAGHGNEAVGRCTLDFSTKIPGVCIFLDGMGQLAGFKARVDVSTAPLPAPNPPQIYTWDGTYSFRQEQDR